jgi:cytochrome b561
MPWRNSADRYGSLSIRLHWFMLLLLAAVYSCIELREFFPKGSGLREGLKTWHFMLGLSVLILASLRLAVRLTSPAPRIGSEPLGWQPRLARLMHYALYAFMIGMPLAGWLLLSAAGKPVPFFGFHWPALMGESKSVAELIQEIHEAGGTVGYFLVGLHAAAALFHHYVMRDGTLSRMLPRQE